MRKKWDEKHHVDGSTYGEETINKAIESTANIYSPEGEPQTMNNDYNAAMLLCSDEDNQSIEGGNTHVMVNDYNAKDDNELAQMVADKINDMPDENSSVYK